MRLAFGVGITDVGYTGGISDGADGGLLSSTFLSTYGPYGMAMDFTDASISINDSTDVLDYNSQGTVSSTGALLGPGSKLTYSAPSLKFVEQADGYIAGQAHNLCLASEDLSAAQWTVGGTPVRTATTIQDDNGAGYETITQTFASGIVGATYTWSFRVTKDAVASATRFPILRLSQGATNYDFLIDTSSGAYKNGPSGSTAYSSASVVDAGAYFQVDLTLTCTNASLVILIFAAGGTKADITTAATSDYSNAIQGTVGLTRLHLRRTPSVSTYVATTSAAVYDLPYVFSGGVKTGIRVEPAATNLNLYSTDFTNAAWTKRGITTATKNQTGPDGIANSACRIANLGAVAGVNDFYETAYVGVRFTASQAITQSFYIRKVTASGVLRITNASSGTLYYSIDFSLLGSGWERITPTHPAVTTGTLTATAGGIFGPFFLAQSGFLDFDLYCTQLETGTVATSPIITYGSSVVRAVDNISGLLSAIPFSATDQTWSAKAAVASGLVTTTGRILGFGAASRAPVYMPGATTVGVFIAGSAATKSTGVAIAGRTVNAVATYSSSSGSKITADGLGTPGTNAATTYTAQTAFYIGSDAGSANVVPGVYNRIAYFPRVLSDAEMQAIST